MFSSYLCRPLIGAKSPDQADRALIDGRGTQAIVQVIVAPIEKPQVR
jgi:hypothetical protein